MDTLRISSFTLIFRLEFIKGIKNPVMRESPDFLGIVSNIILLNRDYPIEDIMKIKPAAHSE